ncbi:MAG TPA: hypothetical protein VJ752_04875 [Burkholderiaceae bacterium]|nr:hypothetical protein [Burkholderiaceae bacterium]
MRRQREQHTWGREQRRDGASEWPSTGFSTLSGELREPKPARRRNRLGGYATLALPFLVLLGAGSLGIMMLARHLHG